MASLSCDIQGIINRAGLEPFARTGSFPGLLVGAENLIGSAPPFVSHTPVNGAAVASTGSPDGDEVEHAIATAQLCFERMRRIPAPRRGELVRRIAELARRRKETLADLITLEAGKIRQEALGEVQELIDICDFAVGLSRQLHGLTLASERPEHRMQEQWHPLGPVAVITAFNFPMAVWAWNAMLAFVCGNPVLWKPSPQTPLCALACHQLVCDALKGMDDLPQSCSILLQGERSPAEALTADRRIALVSATGSCAMGRQVASQVAGRLGRYLLELGGNNALVVTSSADLSLALRAIVFAAVGTSGQRCTSLRRLIVHRSVQEELLSSLNQAYRQLCIGNPFDESQHMGPLISETAGNRFEAALRQARAEGGQLLYGGERLGDALAAGCYVTPALMQMPTQSPIVQEETFAPLLYVLTYDDFDEALALHNAVPQGLSSAIFSNDLREAEQFLGPAGSDCGLANVNIGTSGAEIGGAFGGEKETGGGRESGSDAWKNYMRRATNTINYGHSLPLAQGIRFDL